MYRSIPVVPEPGIIIILFLRDNQYNQETMEYWIYSEYHGILDIIRIPWNTGYIQNTMEYWI